MTIIFFEAFPPYDPIMSLSDFGSYSDCSLPMVYRWLFYTAEREDQDFR